MFRESLAKYVILLSTLQSLILAKNIYFCRKCLWSSLPSSMILPGLSLLPIMWTPNPRLRVYSEQVVMQHIWSMFARFPKSTTLELILILIWQLTVNGYAVTSLQRSMQSSLTLIRVLLMHSNTNTCRGQSMMSSLMNHPTNLMNSLLR